MTCLLSFLRIFFFYIIIVHVPDIFVIIFVVDVPTEVMTPIIWQSRNWRRAYQPMGAGDVYEKSMGKEHVMSGIIQW